MEATAAAAVAQETTEEEEKAWERGEDAAEK